MLYKSLDHSNQEIRVVELLPGNADDLVSCRLEHRTLTSPGDYEALSYVWGNSFTSASISVDGSNVLQITDNLHSALRYLRHDVRSRYVWIDAICINQADTSERSHQVKMMRKVYSSASCVVIWLGDADRGSESSVVSTILRHAEDSRLHWDPALNNPETLTWDKMEMFLFFKNEWWSRTWTIQELLVSRKALFCCGNLSFPAEAVIAMADSFVSHLSPSGCCSPEKVEASNLEHFRMIPELITQAAQILATRDLKGSSVHFLDVANQFRCRSATDARDKVFALLGVSSGLSLDIVDYSASTKDIFERAARDIIENTGVLDPLSYVGSSHAHYGRLSGSDSSSTMGLASWAPDWAPKLYHPIYALHLFNKCRMITQFNAGPYTGSKRVVSGDTGLLAIRGAQWDTVARMAQPCRPDLPLTATDVTDWEAVAGIDETPDQSYIAGGTKISAYWRTLCFDSTFSATGLKRVGEDTNFDYREYRGRMMGESRPSDRDPMAKTYNHYNMTTHSTASVTTFFVSTKKFFGMAPPHTHPGDEIWILEGGRMPFILRRSRLDGRETDTLQLVGDAYIHGIMDGQLWMRPSDLLWKDIELR
jgi:hypothetical protein